MIGFQTSSPRFRIMFFCVSQKSALPRVPGMNDFRSAPAMKAALLRALAAVFDDLETRGDVRVVVVRGAGSAFCSGRDLREMEAREPQVDIVPVLRKVEASRHPTIAMIHGDAVAGGCELA